MESTVFDDIKWIGNGFISTLEDIGSRLGQFGFMKVLQKNMSIRALQCSSKTVTSTVYLLGFDCLKKLGEDFSKVKDLTYAACIFDNANNVINEKPGTKWYKRVSNWLYLGGSICEVAEFSKKYLGVKSFPFFSALSTTIGETSFFKEIDFPLVRHLFLNRVKDLIFLVGCIWNVLVDHTLYWFGTEQDRSAVLSTKNILDHTGNVGKALLICFGVSYFAELPFRILSLFVSVTAQLKVLAFD